MRLATTDCCLLGAAVPMRAGVGAFTIAGIGLGGVGGDA